MLPKRNKALQMKVILDSKFKIVNGIKKMDFAKITAMLKDAYWSKGISIDEVKKGAKHSALVVGAFTKEGMQVGYARVISDKSRFAYILDVYVNEHFRKRGIGQAMIKFILNHPELKDVYQWLLITKDAHGVYSKTGFQLLENPDRWMEIRNPRPGRVHQDTEAARRRLPGMRRASIRRLIR
jgi:GNAT superfamily N-acetyltransferase